MFWHAVSLLNFVLIEEKHAHCGVPRGFWWFSGPGEGLRVVLRVCPGLGDLGFWAYVVQFIAVALLASVQAMKQRKFPAPIVILVVEIGLYVVWFFSRPGGAVDQPSGRMLSKHRSGADAGNGSEFYFDLPATSKGLKA
jgi:hypothetical protein